MKKLLILLCLLILSPKMITAHPHVFIESSVEIEFSDGVPHGVRFRWKFDDFFSRMMLLDFAGSVSGPLSAEQIERLRAGAFENLANFNYFSTILIDDSPLKIEVVEDFRADVAQRTLIYEFLVPLRQPGGSSSSRIDGMRELAIGSFDESFYSYMEFSEEPFSVQGIRPADITSELRKRPDYTYYFDLIVPELLHIKWNP
ncbi:DUF1007 family protein [Spirochaeta dissipatitropha]